MKSGFSATLGSLRREAGLSQRKAAEELGVSQALLSHYENGAREPKLEFVARVCTYYGVTADYLLGRTKERGSPDCVTLSRCPGGADRLLDTIRGIFMRLNDIGNDDLTAMTLKYIYIPAENVHGLLKNPAKLYDPMIDAELKTVESQLVTHARLAFDMDPNIPDIQGDTDDRPE